MILGEEHFLITLHAVQIQMLGRHEAASEPFYSKVRCLQSTCLTVNAELVLRRLGKQFQTNRVYANLMPARDNSLTLFIVTSIDDEGKNLINRQHCMSDILSHWAIVAAINYAVYGRQPVFDIPAKSNRSVWQIPHLVS